MEFQVTHTTRGEFVSREVTGNSVSSVRETRTGSSISARARKCSGGSIRANFFFCVWREIALGQKCRVVLGKISRPCRGESSQFDSEVIETNASYIVSIIRANKPGISFHCVSLLRVSFKKIIPITARLTDSTDAYHPFRIIARATAKSLPIATAFRAFFSFRTWRFDGPHTLPG